ncbi:MAG: DUF502 domain-containing protein [Gemmatimonadetes bacterium]|nr:DUF502 domain-containing protein [Gemmatimonadota bacterium]MYH18997.1 DUF502 domain-containing protein [Gemmatimonadota bacterium]MYK99620.1 DUF502 domain-containing protein [Gemmatimonadota bacterium]
MSTFNMDNLPKRQSRFSRIRHSLKRTMVSGLIALIPLTITIAVLSWLLTWLDSFAAPVIRRLLGLDTHIPGLGILLMLIVIFLAGFVASNVLGRKLITWFEDLMMRLPVARRVYHPVRKILDTFTMTGETRTWKTVVVEYPRRGAWMIAFIAGDIPSEEPRDDLVSVFVPNTPNPAAGRVVIVPRRDVVPVDLSVEEALEFVVSGGTAFSNVLTLPVLPSRDQAGSRSAESLPAESRSTEFQQDLPVSASRDGHPVSPSRGNRLAPASMRGRRVPLTRSDDPV